MKVIGLSLRVQDHSNYKERRDAIDQRWIFFCRMCGIIPILLPNDVPTVREYIAKFSFSGFILTGGNTLHPYGGNAPEKDEVELDLLQYAIKKTIPILGVCRGMQLMQHFFSIPLIKITGHVGIEHLIFLDQQKRCVNSYHDFGTEKTVPECRVVARSEDNIIEAIEHRKYPIKGIMWHPERYDFFQKEDIAFITSFFGCV